MLHDLKLKFKEELKPRSQTDYIILHHSEVSTPHTAEDIHRWHQKNGWAGISYHYFINKDGEIYKCCPRDTVGAYAKEYNENSIGVCFEGNFYKEMMTDAQVSFEVNEFLDFLQLAYPESEIVFCDELENREVPAIKGFRKKEIWDCQEIFRTDPSSFDRIPAEEWDEY